MPFSHTAPEAAQYPLGYLSLKTSPIQPAMCKWPSVVSIENWSVCSVFSQHIDSKIWIIPCQKIVSVTQTIKRQNKCCGLQRRYVIIIYYKQFVKHTQLFIATYLCCLVLSVLSLTWQSNYTNKSFTEQTQRSVLCKLLKCLSVSWFLRRLEFICMALWSCYKLFP